MGGSCDEDEGRKDTQESFQRIHRTEKISCKAQKKMDSCSGRGCEEDVETQELEKVGRGQRCMKPED